MTYANIAKIEQISSSTLSFTETAIAKAMLQVSEQAVSSMLGRIRKAIDMRKDEEIRARANEALPMSPDFKFVQALDDRTVARYFVTLAINPEAYLSRELSDADWTSKTKLDIACRTISLKGYAKTRETANYFAHNAHLQMVLKAFTACAIISAQSTRVLPRDVCTRFLNSAQLHSVSNELKEALEDYRAKHMSTGASTQTSQSTLQLANMRAASVVRNGRYKDFVLDVNSIVIESFAQRFGMTDQLEKARAFQARLAETALSS